MEDIYIIIYDSKLKEFSRTSYTIFCDNNCLRSVICSNIVNIRTSIIYSSFC